MTTSTITASTNPFQSKTPKPTTPFHYHQYLSSSSPLTTTTNPKHSLRAQSTNNHIEPNLTTPTIPNVDQPLLTLLKQRKTEEAWLTYTQSLHLPNPTCLSRLVSQLSYQNTKQSLTRAQSILRRLRELRQLHCLDANSLGLLAVSAAKAGHTLYAVSIIKSMLKSGYLPHVKAWSAVVSRLAASADDGPTEAHKLFMSVTRRIRRFADPGLATDMRPDTAAYNAVLNACANLGDTRKFVQVFDEMPEFGAKPDVLTYNILIKLCARVDRRDLLVFVLEKIIDEGIVPCVTTLHSLVAAYVGFNDLETAEKLIQAMREGRRDICKILRDSNYHSDMEDSDSDSEYRTSVDEEVFKKLLPKYVIPNDNDPPMFPKSYSPDTRMYTILMKGYMKVGRASDVVRMLEAMRHESDVASHPDHVTYTTVVSALVKVGSMERARQVLAEMARVGVSANRVTYNVLLKGYCQQLQVDKAKELINEMLNNGEIEPDVISYNIIIDGCILIDDSTGALAYFNEMRVRGIAPSKVSYTTLMKAFALAGQPKLVQKVFDEMEKDSRVKVDLVAWNMLVEGYCRKGLIEETKRIVEKMRDNGFYPDVATYGSLANGIALARKPGEALILWSEIKERLEGGEKGEISSPSPPLKPDEGLLDTLAEVCVRAAFFKKALEIVVCMEEYGISPKKIKYTRIYVEMHSKMFTSKHASRARQERRSERKRAAEAFKFWLGLPNSYYGSEWRLEPVNEDLAL
ncbi:hypothetical protein GIB67_002182 [Kingdonia uniflora]|uniref:At1g68980-like TPR repeats domain-containing protein n=1 Tax=Kingdonia uniflora TaxID=39325 RepID=A0A7J7KWP1_9MAGN|nr:hypothetical protein GIB67_002182 [Kingdonia uniflora]